MSPLVLVPLCVFFLLHSEMEAKPSSSIKYSLQESLSQVEWCDQKSYCSLGFICCPNKTDCCPAGMFCCNVPLQVMQCCHFDKQRLVRLEYAVPVVNTSKALPNRKGEDRL